MCKLSIDLRRAYGAGDLVEEDVLKTLVSACRTTLERLRSLDEAVEAFRVEFGQVGGIGNGPIFTVHFSDPLGTKCSHCTDFRFIGTGSEKPTAEEIVVHLCSSNCLPRFISEHLAKCEGRMAKAQRALDAILPAKR